MNTESADHACHDLLVELAGRLPDELIWRLRDWLAADVTTQAPRDAVSAMLPRELLRHHVGLTEHERDLLAEAAGGWGTARRLLDAMLPSHVPAELAFTFGPDPAPADRTALSVLAVVRGYPGCTQLSLARRFGGDGEQRVILVHGGHRPWLLTATLQRILRAHGDRTPCVEVLSPIGSFAAAADHHALPGHHAVPDHHPVPDHDAVADQQPDEHRTTYHSAATAAAVRLWRAGLLPADELVGARS